MGPAAAALPWRRWDPVMASPWRRAAVREEMTSGAEMELRAQWGRRFGGDERERERSRRERETEVGEDPEGGWGWVVNP